MVEIKVEACLPKEAFTKHDRPSLGDLDRRYVVRDVTYSIDTVKTLITDRSW
jgi:hypothetical protein